MYKPKLNPSRGLMIEKCQPITKMDLELARRVLKENDELIFCVGSAGYSHEPTQVMTAGERIEAASYVFKNEGVDLNRVIILPIEDTFETSAWVSEVVALTPRFNKIYTRNFKNASMFSTFQKQFGYNVVTVDEQKAQKDLFALLSNASTSETARKELDIYVPTSALEKMAAMGVVDRVEVIYNRVNKTKYKSDHTKRALFLGGFQPFTGNYLENTGHVSNVNLGLSESEQVVIAIGSSQRSLEDGDPLTAGQRIEVIRYMLMANGTSAEKFFTIPINDIAANASFAAKVISYSPRFDTVIAGNDWTKQLFGKGDYNVVAVERSSILGTKDSLSATKVREKVKEIIRMNGSKEDKVSLKTIRQVEKALSGMVDKHTLDILRNVGFYDTMRFLAFAKE